MPRQTSSNPAKDRQFYENLYQSDFEPWAYRHRGAEILRHETIVRVLKDIRPDYPIILDIGASLGQLTRKLSELGNRVLAFDVSLTAVRKALPFCRPQSSFHFFAARLPGIPLRPNQFDLIIASDCIHEFVPQAARPSAVREIGDLLNAGGMALFCDYMRPGNEGQFRDLILKSGLKIVRMVRMHDRTWYQFESWFKALRNFRAVKKMLGAVWIAKLLRYPAMLMGQYGSTHVLIVASKD